MATQLPRRNRSVRVCRSPGAVSAKSLGAWVSLAARMTKAQPARTCGHGFNCPEGSGTTRCKPLREAEQHV